MDSTFVNMALGGAGVAAVDVASNETPLVKIIIGAITVVIQVLHYFRERKKDKSKINIIEN